MSIMRRKCIKCGLARSADPEVTYHRFPNPGKNTVEKAKAWAKFCFPEEDYSSIEYLKTLHFGSKILCSRHFLNSQFMDVNRTKLSKHAIPTVTNLEYYKRKPIKCEIKEEPPEPDVEEVDFSTEVEYLSDWDSLEDTTETKEDPANTMIESNNENVMPGVTIKMVPRNDAIKQNIKSPNTIQDSALINTYSTTVKIENDTPKKTVKNEKYSITSEIQDYNNSPVLSEIVKRALSKSGVTMKKISKPNEFEKPKELDINKSGVQSRKPIVVNKSDIVTRVRKTQPSIVQTIETESPHEGGLLKKVFDSQESIKTEFNEDDDDEKEVVFANNDPDDEDYQPSEGTAVDSDGEEEHFKGFSPTTPSKPVEPVDLVQTQGVCRCCLKEGEHRVANIPEVLNCLNMHPNEDPKLSQLVCEACEVFLNQVRQFRNMVATSEVELTSRIHGLEHPGAAGHDTSQPPLDMEVESQMQIESIESMSADSDGLSEQEELARELAEPIDLNPRREAKPRPPGTPNNRERLQILRQNVITIILNSTILPFTFNKDPMLINQFECIYHDARYTEFHRLRKHMNEKHPKLDEKYIKTFVNGLQKGILRADISNLTCRRCRKILPNLDALAEHLVKRHGLKYKDMKWDPPHNILGFDLSTEEMKCPVCSKPFPTFRGLLAHMNQHYGSFLCPLCGMKFLYPDSFSKHKKSHDKIAPVKTVICDKCGLNFTSRLQLVNHRRNHCGPGYKIGNYKKKVVEKKQAMPKSIEIEIDNFDCMLCDVKFTNGGDYFEHRMEHLSQSKAAMHVCEICGYTVKKKNHLRRHLKRHYGIKDVKCPVCNKGFVSAQDLKLHSNTHQARFQCPFCSDVCFITKSECSYHIKSEHEDMLPKKRINV